MNLGMENETIEYKKSTGELKEAVISIASILNKHQKGELYFGVRNDGVPVGQIITDKTLRDISQAIADHIEPKVYSEISVVSIDGSDVIRVGFEGYNRPYSAYGAYRIRVADEDLPMTRAQLASFFADGGEASSWELRTSSCTLDDVDDKRVSLYVDRGVHANRLAFEYQDKKTTLGKLKLLDGDHLLNAGMVLFCESLYAEVQMAVFATPVRLTFLDIKRARAPVFELVKRAEMYIASNIRWRVEFDGSIQRKEIPEIPMDAVREALVNSFCHKDYGACQPNEVTIHPDRVVIYNPGSFPVGLTPQDFIDGDPAPVRRNPLIASILYYSKDIESFGTGFKRIAMACNEAGCKYSFDVQKHGFSIIFHRNADFIPDAKNYASFVSDSGGSKNEQVNEQVNEQEMLLLLLRKNPCLTYSQLADMLELSNATVRRRVARLVDEGRLERFGSDKKGGWKVLG